MRKKTINNLADTIFWYSIYFLPVIAYLLYILALPSTSANIVPFMSFFDSVGFGFVTDNVIITTLTNIFGQGGIFPLFNSQMPFVIVSWFIYSMILHLAVDVLLFIPRLAHKWLDYFTKG